MRVVIDLRAAHPGLTGIGRYAVNLCLSLETVRGPFTVLAITTQAGKEYMKGMVGSAIHVVPSGDPKWDDLGLPDLLASLGADVYHSPLFILPRINVCPSVCTIHDVIPLARPDLTPPSFAQFFHKHVERAMQHADHVVTVSDFSRRDILRFFPTAKAKVSFIHEPVSPMFHRRSPADCQETLMDLGLEPGFILYVGAIDRRKNLGSLLDAYASLRADGILVPPLVIVGEPSGDGFDIRSEVIRLGISGAAKLLGRVSDSILAYLYSSAEIFAFPSLYEGFGLPVLEAMACGAPVLTSRTTSIPEIVGDAALLIDPLRMEDIKEGLRNLLRNPALRSSLIRKGLARSAEFNVEMQGERLLEVYQKVVKVVA